MRSAVVLALAAGALAVPYKRDVVTQVDVVYETDVVTVWAGQETSSSSVAVAPEAASSTPEPSSSVAHYGHNHWSQGSHYGYSQPATSESSSPAPTTPTTTYVAPAPSTTSTYVAPTTSSTSTYVAPTTSETSTYVAPTTSETSTYVAPTTSSTWVAPSSSATWAAPSSAAPAKPTSYQELAVYHHNIHRANHSAPDIAWDDGLASTAATIAASCVYAHNTDTNGGGYGQNIAAGVEPANISAIITDLFYNGEVGWYDGLYGQAQPDMTNFEHWGHFSQIVWADTTHVGCATQHCPNGLGNVGSDVSPYFTVCNYKNPGNFANEYGSNVGKSLNQPTAEWNAGM